MDIQKLMIWYKDGSVDMVKQNELKRKHVDRRKVQLILCPDLYRANVMIPLIPNPVWLASEFSGKIIMQASMIDYDEIMISPLKNIPSEIHTTSLIEFVYYITSFYRVNGFNDQFDDSPMRYAFYPIWYEFQFKDASGDVIDSVDSGKLESVSSDTYWDDGIIDFICKDRLRALRHMIYDVECSGSIRHTISILPRIIMISDNTAHEIKKTSRIPMDSIVLYRLYGYESYMVSTPRINGKILNHLPAYLNIAVYDKNAALEKQFSYADSFMNEAVNLDLKLSDPNSFMGFSLYLREFIDYLKVIYQFLYEENYDDQSKVYPSVQIQLEEMNHTAFKEIFLDKEISNGELYSKLVYYATK